MPPAAGDGGTSVKGPKKCSFCDLTFAKRDHVMRHERSHTKEKPFPCEQCNRTFSRQDVLYRHQRNHTNNPTPAESRRRKVATGSPSRSAGTSRGQTEDPASHESETESLATTRPLAHDPESSAGVDHYSASLTNPNIPFPNPNIDTLNPSAAVEAAQSLAQLGSDSRPRAAQPQLPSASGPLSTVWTRNLHRASEGQSTDHLPREEVAGTQDTTFDRYMASLNDHSSSTSMAAPNYIPVNNTSFASASASSGSTSEVSRSNWNQHGNTNYGNNNLSSSNMIGSGLDGFQNGNFAPQNDGNIWDIDVLQLLSASTLPFSNSLQASPQFYQSLGIPVPGSAQSLPDIFNTSGTVDWARLAQGGSGPTASFAAIPQGQLSHSSGDGQNLSAGDERVECEDEIVPSVGQDAITKAQGLVADLSTSLTSQMHFVSSGFLDRSLAAFLSRFIPTFPVLHPGTFNIRQTSAPLLINMIVMGSLWIQSDDARPLTDGLWKLAHKAVAGTWDQLIEQQGNHDPCKGIALIMTALLGQMYAAYSNSPNLQSTASVFHSLGFRWSRLAGMYKPDVTQRRMSLADLNSLPREALEQTWCSWAALESQRRAVLSHYYMDGQLCSLFDVVPSVRHMSNPFTPTASDTLFLAPTAEAWRRTYELELEDDDQPQRPFSAILDDLLRSDESGGQAPSFPSLSPFNCSVLLEALYSLVVDLRDSTIELRRRELIPVTKALQRFRTVFLDRPRPSSNRTAIDLRWHMVSIAALELHLPSAQVKSATQSDIRQWFESPQGRRALLHANAIRQGVETMPFAATSSPHSSAPAVCYHAARVVLLWWNFRSGWSGKVSAGKGSQRMTGGRGAYYALEDNIDWEVLGGCGHNQLGLVPGDPLSNTISGPIPPRSFITMGGKALLGGSELEPVDVSSLISVLRTIGGTWPTAHKLASELIALSYVH